MDKATVQFVGKELGQHGANIYFKEFSVAINGEKRSYKLGDFYFVQTDPRKPVCIAEFQLIWMNLKDGRKLAAAKLYFKPEDTKQGRLPEHGEDELMEADRYVAIHCEQMPAWECKTGLAFGRPVYQGVPAANELISNINCSQLQGNCHCNTINGNSNNSLPTLVKVLSFPAYCRYRATLKLIQSRHILPMKMILARGAVEVDCIKTRILFNRFKFQRDDIDSFALADNIRVPVFKGRPRKRRQSRTKAGNDVKKSKIEKENSNPEASVKFEELKQENLIKADVKMGNAEKESNSQTYRIVSPPANCDPDRNVIHVKIENKKTPSDLYKVKSVEKEEMKVVIKTNGNADDNYIAEKENLVCWDRENIDEGSLDSPQLSEDDLLLDGVTGAKDEGKRRLSKGEGDEKNPPSELVKNGKTGTVLDEAFFREMRNGMKGAEEVDKEKMRKILVESCTDVEGFKRDLFLFMKQKGTPIVYVPKIGYTRVDLQKLFSLVVSNGGYRQVTLNHKWKKVYDEMALATTITSAATCMRRHYEKLLLPYEKHLRVKHRQDALSSKTYSISAQASQPLVLTIKTIKCDNVEEDDLLSTTDDGQVGHNASFEMAGSDVVTGCRYEPVNMTDCDASYMPSKDMVDVVPSSLSMAASHFSLLKHRSPSSEERYEHPKAATVTGPVVYPHGKDRVCTQDGLADPTIDMRQIVNSPSNVSHHEHQQPARVSHSSSADKKPLQLFNATSHIITNSTGPTFYPSNSGQTCSTAFVYSATGEHRSVITRQESSQSFSDTFPIMSTERSSEKSHGSQQVRKRRGRPPKNARPNIEVLEFETTAQNDLKGRALPSFVHNESMVEKHPGYVAKNSQDTVPTTTLGNGRPCAPEVERRSASKKGGVKLYEYVVNSDSANSKMVKHQQGIIPSFSDSKASKRIPMPARSIAPCSQQSWRNEEMAHQLSGVKNSCHVTNLSAKGHVHYPRVETVMSFSSKGCLPSTLVSDSIDRSRLFGAKNGDPASVDQENPGAWNDLKFHNVDEPIVYSMHSRMKSYKDSVNNRNERKEDQSGRERRCSEPRSVIVGPPPLVPIDKHKGSNSNVSQQVEAWRNTAMKYTGGVEKKFDAKLSKPNEGINSGVEHISLVSDIKAMKETFNVDSIIKPFTKSIDQSLADLRKETVTRLDKEPIAKLTNGLPDEIYPTESFRSDVRVQKGSELPCKKNLKSAGHNELRVEVDRVNEAEFNRNYEMCRRHEREVDYKDVDENDPNQRLLRIASLGDFEAYSQEVAMQKYPQQKERLEEELRASKLENSSVGHRLPIHQGRPDLEALESRGSKIGKYNEEFLHPFQHEMVMLSDKYLYSEGALAAQRSLYLEELGRPHGPQKSLREKPQEKYMLNREEFHHSGSRNHGEVHCHRKSYQSEDARHHHREAAQFGDLQHRRKLHRDQHSQHVPLAFFHDHRRGELSYPSHSPEAVYYDSHRGDHHHKHLMSPFQAASPHSDYHIVNSIYAGRRSSPVYDHKQVPMIETSSPTSIRSGWYGAHHLPPVVGKDGRSSVGSAMYWHQKVHH